MFSIYQRVLPRARAWRTTIDKPLTRFFKGLGASAQDVRAEFDDALDDLYPQATRQLARWELEFGLPTTNLTEQERRDRLAAEWQALGGQDPEYIQATLRGAGFDVYVHDWWEPGTEPAVGVKACVTPRNPLLVLRRSQQVTGAQVTCGNPAATCGNPAATCGSTLTLPGYPLVNKVTRTTKEYTVTCGSPAATCGSPAATCGAYSGFAYSQIDYVIPSDASKWPFFTYVGGAVYGELAQVPPARKNEFEALCLKICPAHLWIGVLVQYN